MTNIKYGREILETTFYDSKPSSKRRLEVRDTVLNDSEELAHFIKMQQEHKDCKHMTFERKITDKGVRYIVKSWDV